MRYLLFFFGLTLAFTFANGQANDPVLFSVGDEKVLVSEFAQIYAKNNREDADFSEASLREYLDLYTKFKLKVREAYAMKLDTVYSLRQELEGYRRQLAESYLTDKEITDRLTREAHNRMQEDVRIAHILVRTTSNTPADTLAAYQKIQTIYQRLQGGEDWNELARAVSEDNDSKNQGGDIGYITAMLPNGFYSFETAAYETPVGNYSAPVKSAIGYHIIKILDKRPARGEMDVAHILLRVKEDGSNEAAVKANIDNIYKQVRDGAKFDEFARNYSEDKSTKDRGGVIGPIAINQYETAFEDAAFGIENDGEVSQPVRTTLGWHLIKRMRKRGVLNFEMSKRRIENQINRDERIAVARQSLAGRVLKEAGYTFNQAAYDELVANAGTELQTYRWTVPNLPEVTLMTLGNESYSNLDFAQFVRNNARTRMTMPKGSTNAEILDKVYAEYINEKALQHEEKHLATKYPEFAAVMREYEEGILLFEATKINVWDKASRDTVGLTAFHQANREKYMWDERLEASTIVLDSTNLGQLATVKKWAVKSPATKVAEKAKKKKIGVEVSRRIYQKDEALPNGLIWKAGHIADLEDGRGFVKVERLIPATPKSLDEARGYIISDYQDYLEKEWVNSLLKKYPVQVDESALKRLVRK